MKRVTGGQLLLLAECPFCSKPKHLYFNEATGVWKCQRCGEIGNVLTMKRRLGDLEFVARSARQFYFGALDSDQQGKAEKQERPPQGIAERSAARLQEQPEALEYLRSVRGFTDETIAHFQLGYAEKGRTGYLVIPHIQGGEVVNVKFRALPPAEKGFARWPGCPSVLFNVDSLAGLSDLPSRERVVMVCEGETDAMALTQLGYERVISSTAGAGSWREEWLEVVEPATTVLLCYDSDDAGEAGAEKAAQVLGRWRCRRVAPVLHDFAEMVAAGMGRTEVDEAIRKAHDYEQGTLRPTSSYANELMGRLRGPMPKGRPTGWLELDTVLGGFRDGELTVVTGDTGSGKSTFCMALTHKQLNEGVPCMVAPFEQRPWETLIKLVSMESGRSAYQMSEDELADAVHAASRFPLYFLDRHGPTPLSEIKDAIYHAVHRFGVELVVLDHLHYFLDSRPDHERHAIDTAMRSLKLWAVDLGIHIFLVVHPAKLGRDGRGVVRKVEMDDLKGSSEIKKEADNGIRVHRERGDEEDMNRSEIAVLKCRSPAGSEGRSWFYFDPECEQYIGGAPAPESRGKAKSRRKGSGEPSAAPFDARSAAAGEEADEADYAEPF